MHRSISSPLAALLINKYSPRKAQAAYLALWLGSGKNSIPIVSDPVNTFNDAWAKEHMTAPQVIKAYSPAAIKAIEANFQVVSPPIYLTGYLEFQDTLGKNLSEAYVGPASRQGRAQEDRGRVERHRRAASAAPSSRRSSRATRR